MVNKILSLPGVWPRVAARRGWWWWWPYRGRWLEEVGRWPITATARGVRWPLGLAEVKKNVRL
jgi:hypothetical protein